jgi:hypothetical protein
MSRAKVFTSILMVLILTALSGASVWAAPNGQEGEESISGIVREIVIEVDEEGTTTILVTLVDDSGATQTVRLSLETATALGLVGEDTEGNPAVNEDMIGETVEIDPGDVIEDGEEALHPVASALTEFFDEILELEEGAIMGYHEAGMGFGVIAQACWMSYALEGDARLLDAILNAKKNHDFNISDPDEGTPIVTLPDGKVPTNWGQFKKAVLRSEKVQKNLANLGAIMSGRAEREQEQEATATSNQGQGKGKKSKGSDEEVGGPPAEPPGKSKNKGSEGDELPTEPPGKGKNKDKGEDGGKPDTPPGQDKGGDKGKGK